MGYRLTSMNEYYRTLGVNIFMVSYRGYGRSLKKQKVQKNLHGLAYGRSLHYRYYVHICVFIYTYTGKRARRRRKALQKDA